MKSEAIKIPVDMFGTIITTGSDVARAKVVRSSPYIQICKVTKIENGKVYLDGSKKALIYPELLLVIQAIED